VTKKDILIQRITALSEANEWLFAKDEWELYYVWESDEPMTCLCTHFPIIEICEVRNTQNGNKATVGNCCVKHFLGLPSHRIFAAVKRVRKDLSTAFNPATLKHAYKRGWIDDWQLGFSLGTWRRRNLSVCQLAQRKKINLRILRMLSRDKEQAHGTA
jgi:hypothetical protein